MQMPIWDHLEELRERVLVGALAAGIAVLTCFAFSKDLVVFLEAPVASQGVRFLQLSPGEFFFTTLKASPHFWHLTICQVAGDIALSYECTACCVPCSPFNHLWHDVTAGGRLCWSLAGNTHSPL